MSPLTFEQLSWAVAVLVPVATLALTLRREESTAHKVTHAATEATLGDHERRITALEHRCETCRVGGTD